MAAKKKIFAIIGSANTDSANLKVVEFFARLTERELEIVVYTDLKKLPHFDPELSAKNPPAPILALRKEIENADGVLICTPEYIFSIPSGLKNAIEWCIATTVFSDKPTALITASASGLKGHEELQLIMKTAMASFTDQTSLLIQGIKGKINERGEITDATTRHKLSELARAFISHLKSGN